MTIGGVSARPLSSQEKSRHPVLHPGNGATSRVLIGRPVRLRGWPVAKAHRGVLPSDDDGIPLLTDAPPPGSHPYEVFWWMGDRGVWNRRYRGETFAVIVVA
jgi:hypothetical protein